MAQSAEQKKSYHVIKSFKGINTKANRTSIDEEEFAWLENAMPIGFSNLKVVSPQLLVRDSGNVAVTWSNTVTYFSSVNLSNNDYVVAFEQNGGAEYFNVTTSTKGTIAAAGKFTGTNVRVDQWKNERMLISDPQKGYFTWDGNVVVSVGSIGTLAIANAGSGYTSAPAVIISAPNDANGVQAIAEASISGGVINSVTLIEAGSGYTVAPTVTLNGGGGANGNIISSIITFATGTVSVTVKNGGTGYTNVPNIVVTITGGGGTNAAASAIASNGQITQVLMTNPGTGYINTSNLVVTISGGNGSNANVKGTVMTDNVTSLTSFSGRTWLSQGRTVYYSAAGTYNDFATVSAGNQTIADSSLHSNINRLLAANNFLYVFGDDSINVFSDVRVTSAGTTLFTNTNVSSSIGSKRSLAIFPYFRSILFMNDYGIYALIGSTVSKLSDPLDGIFPNIAFSNTPGADSPTGGEVLLNNILCAMFNFYYNDPSLGLRAIQAVFFEKKWFITSQGDIDYTTSVSNGGNITIYGTDTANLYSLYTNTSSLASISTTIKTALSPLTDPIRDKQVLKLGVEATNTNTAAIITATVDNENRSSSPYSLSSSIAWQNNNLQSIGWSNNSSTIIGWATIGYFLYRTDAQQYGKYIGVTLTSNNTNLVINGLFLEHELRTRF